MQKIIVSNKVKYIPNSYSIFWSIIRDINKKMGSFSKEYKFLGIYCYSNGSPYISLINDNNEVYINLTENAKKDKKILNFQLSHECVHLLSPSRKLEANYLEEGLAVYYSRDRMIKFFNLDVYKEGWIQNKYKIALECILKLEKLNKLSIYEIIKRIRTLEPIIYNINKKHFNVLNINYNDEILELLLSDFY